MNATSEPAMLFYASGIEQMQIAFPLYMEFGDVDTVAFYQVDQCGFEISGMEVQMQAAELFQGWEFIFVGDEKHIAMVFGEFACIY